MKFCAASSRAAWVWLDLSMMQTPDNIIRESVARMLADVVSPKTTLAAEEGGIDRAAWNQFIAMGLTGADAGALGLSDTADVLQAIVYAGALVPFADSEALARWLALGAGIASESSEILSCLVVPAQAIVHHAGGATAQLKGQLVPWGRHCSRILLSFGQGASHHVAIARLSPESLRQQANLAGEPADVIIADTLALDSVHEVAAAWGPSAVRQRGALCRSAAMQGAAQHALELAIRYASDRKQFGKSLSQFQMIQSYLAQMAGELTASGIMLQTCLDAMTHNVSHDGAEVAALKIQAGMAARTIASLSHQIHGAMGFTQEYPLHLWTRRLWAWREEWGNETEWALELGGLASSLGADGVWERIAG